MQSKRTKLSINMSKYNITDKKDKNAAYRSLVKAELVDELYEKIVNILFVQKKYRDCTYSAKKLADEIGTNTRYISAVVNMRFHQNYSCLVNEYRIKEAMYMLVDKRYDSYTMEEISKTVGFANRQSFYAAFFRVKGVSPRAYKKTQQVAKTKKQATEQKQDEIEK